jgi:hypothetical protein
MIKNKSRPLGRVKVRGYGKSIMLHLLVPRRVFNEALIEASVLALWILDFRFQILASKT